MKKLLAILLVLTMVFSLAACNSNTDKPNQTTPPTTESTPTEPVIDTAAKQAFYDKYFTSDEYKPAGTSFKGYNDSFSMSQQMDADGYGVLEITAADCTVRIYRTEAGVYVYSKAPNEETGDIEELWMKYEEGEGENILESNDMGSDSVPELTDIKKITYVDTQNGLDHVTVEVSNPEYDATAKYTEYTLEFSYGEKKYTVNLYEVNSEDSHMVVWSNDDSIPEEIDLYEYTLDVENSNLVHAEDTTKNLTCTIVETKDAAPAATMVFDMYINAETHELVKVGAEEEGVYTTLEYFNVEKYETDVEFPAEADECTPEELGMIIMALLLMTAV